MNQNMMDILDAREQRVLRQGQLLRRLQKPLVCLTLNIPGPEKNHPLADQGFRMGCRLLENALTGYPVLHREQRNTPAGWEGFFAVDAPAETLKALCVGIEDTSPIGRVLDLDVLGPQGEKLERGELGYPRRKCLLCQEDAAVCGRSRAHSLEDLREAVFGILRRGIGETVAELAVRSLLCELYATPKPGLVDQNNTGSHRDMDLFTFLRSTAALWPYFRRCAEIGLEEKDPEAAFAKLREAGLEAEQRMLRATGGVNTHKGAIFTLGILCGAAGMVPADQWKDPEALGAQCAAMTRGLVRRDLSGEEEPRTTGEKLYAQFGLTGARGQAEAGFPGARNALPVLEKGLEQGLSLNDALCAALVHILSSVQDTCMIRRGGRVMQMQLQAALKTMLSVQPYPTKEVLESLDQMFIKRNLSPGGSADLLAATCFLHFLKEA